LENIGKNGFHKRVPEITAMTRFAVAFVLLLAFPVWTQCQTSGQPVKPVTSSAQVTDDKNQNQTAEVTPAEKDTDQGPSYDDTVKWIQDNIGLAGTPPSSKQKDDSAMATTKSSSGISYSIAVDGCKNLTVIRMEKLHFTMTPHQYASAGFVDTTDTMRFKLPFSSILSVDGHTQRVFIRVKDGGTFSEDVTNVDENGPQPPISNPPEPLNNTTFFEGSTKTGRWTATGMWGGILNVLLDYNNPGAEDAPPHMGVALQHLVDVCKNHPEQAPKQLF
jgi:hypothetical protein